MAIALQMPSPFATSFVLDDDGHYAARQMAVVGPVHHVWRMRIAEIVTKIQRAIALIEKWARSECPSPCLMLQETRTLLAWYLWL